MDKAIKIGLIFIMSSIHVQSFNQTTNQPEKRIALVIGNGNYLGSILANPENDAKSMAEALRRLGFMVYLYENLNSSQMKRAIDDFGMILRGNDVGLFYYAGHGIQAKGFNYLIPVDAQLKTEEQVEYDCVRADRLLSLMETSGTKVNVIILDACRNNPFERSWTRSPNGRGLAFMNAPGGTLIAYSTSPGNTAQDGSGRNSPYTSAILKSIEIPGITIIQMFQNVRNIVSQITNKRQIPWESTSLTGDFYFNPDRDSSIIAKTQVPKLTANELITRLTGDLYSNPERDSSVMVKAQIPESTTNESITSESVDFLIDTRDGLKYKTVRIGNQTWMADNLKTTHYSDGRTIMLISDNKEWKRINAPAYCWYDNNEAAYSNTYGALYNWQVVSTGLLCPKGWHIPTVMDWITLITYLGGVNIAGGQLKESGTSHWESPNNDATNETGFTALPGGIRSSNGKFEEIGESACWWSSTTGGWDVAAGVGVEYNKNVTSINYQTKNGTGCSIRCIKD
jgi:uncharacterized protein (TIGR02145 family)